jgi:hypothetical protein
MSDFIFSPGSFLSGFRFSYFLVMTILTISSIAAQPILLKSGEFDPGEETKNNVPPVNISLGAEAGEHQLVLVQWNGPVDQSRIDWLRSLGGRTIFYVPRNACFALIPGGMDLEHFKSLSGGLAGADVRWASALSTRWKTDGPVAKRLDHFKKAVEAESDPGEFNKPRDYIVQMVKTGVESGFEGLLKSLAHEVRVHSETTGWINYYITASAEDILSLVKKNAVLWIEESRPIKLLGERANLSMTNIQNSEQTCISQGLQDPEAVALGLTDWLRTSFTMNPGQNAFLYVDLFTIPDYTIQPGDVLEYDIFWPVNSELPNPETFIAVDLATAETSLREESAVDQNGYGSHPGTNIGSFALGNIYHRAIPVPAGMTDQTIRNYLLGCERDNGGTVSAYIRNIFITDGSGQIRFFIWGSGQGTPLSVESLNTGSSQSYVLDTGDYEGFLNRIGLRGENIIVQVMDDGISQGIATGEPGTAHPDLFGRISGIENASLDEFGDSGGGHGHLQASIIAGDPLGSLLREDPDGFRLGQGIAPASKIFASKIFSNDQTPTIRSYDSLIRKGYEEGARISNNSWGSGSFGQYTVDSQLFDILTRDANQFFPGLQEMLHVFAAGNDGPIDQSVSAPATAKNVISVGAAENCDNSPVLDKSGISDELTDNLKDLAIFSSRGSGPDGRIQVHVTAPGTHVYGAASDSPDFDGSGVSGRDPSELQSGEAAGADIYAPAFQSAYTWSSGTSHAAPLVTGGAVLLRQFYMDRHGHVASPALVKASFVIEGIDMQGGLLNDPAGGIMDFIPNGEQGWGRASIEPILAGNTFIQFYDQQQVLAFNGEEHLFQIDVSDGGRSLEIALVWTDPAGSTAVTATLVNDLDLVINDGLNDYHGNIYMNGQSIPSTDRDSVNNVETFRLDPPHMRFAFDVKVRAVSINEDGIPGSGADIEQDYALIILNGVERSGIGSLSFDKLEYDCDENNLATVNLTDFDARGQGTIQVNVSSLEKGDSETVALFETAVNNGIYSGSIEINKGNIPVPESGFLTVQDTADTLRATYVDNTNGQDVTAHAGVDCRFFSNPNLPDLLADNVSIVNPDFMVGEGFSVNVEWQNMGGSASPIARNDFYASPDRVITGEGNDVLLREYFIPGIESEGSIDDSESNNSAVVIHTNQLGPGKDEELTPGEYFLGIIIDAQFAISESNEENNIFLLEDKFEASAVSPGKAQTFIPMNKDINVAIFDSSPFNVLQSGASRSLNTRGKNKFNMAGTGHPAPWKLNEHPLLPGSGGLDQGQWCRYPLPKTKPQRIVSPSLIPVEEDEPNDTPQEAQALPLTFDLTGDVDVDVSGDLENTTARDFFQITLSKGDVLGAACIGDFQLDPILSLTNSFGTEQVTNDDDGGSSALYPPGSPLPSGEYFLDSALSYIAPMDGDFRLRVTSFMGTSSGSYNLRIRLRRPGFESKAVPATQLVFLDFDGATINALELYGEGNEEAVLSPLSTFLAGWGIDAMDEDAVIDAIIAGVQENFDDLRRDTLNGDRDVDGIDGHFDVEFLNSRDHADPFGNPDVSRIIFGGTVEELGFTTIGIAESIDPGNFAGEETGVVLLDLLSAAPPDPDSVNSIPRDASVSLIEAIGLVVGTIGAHEIGHYIGNWHTENSNTTRCIMDQGGDLTGNIAGVGDDGILGTGDDVDSDFIRDVYANEGVSINSTFENTDVRSAFGLATAGGGPAGSARSLRWLDGGNASQYDVYFNALANVEVDYVSHLITDEPPTPGLVPIDIASGLLFDPDNFGIIPGEEEGDPVTDANDEFPDLVVAWHGGEVGPDKRDDEVIVYIHNKDNDNPAFIPVHLQHPKGGGFPEISSVEIAYVDSPPLLGQGSFLFPPDFRYIDKFPVYRRPLILITSFADGGQPQEGSRNWNPEAFPWPPDDQIIPALGIPGQVYLVTVNDFGTTFTVPLVNAMEIAIEFEGEPLPMPVRLAIPEQINSVAVNDFDSDGDFDICAGADRGDVVVWYENLQAEVVAHNSGAAELDIEFPYDDPSLFSNGVVLAILAEGAAELGEPLVLEIGFMQNFRALPISQSFDNPFGDAHDIAAQDLNGDGLPDIVTVSVQDDAIYYFQNNGLDETSQLGNKPVLWADRQLLMGENTLDGVNNVELADLNRDGRFDIIVTAFNDDKVSVFRNEGNLMFTEIILTESLDEVEDLFVEDVNGDGFLDVMATSAVDDRIEWYTNDGELNFSTTQAAVDIDRPQEITVTDVNGDLLPDVVAASSFNISVNWLKNEPQIIREEHQVAKNLVLPKTEVPQLDFNNVYVWNVVSTAGPFETLGDTWSFRSQHTRMDVTPIIDPMSVELDGFLNIDIQFTNIGPALPTLPESVALDLRDWRTVKAVGPFPWYMPVIISQNSLLGDEDDILLTNFINPPNLNPGGQGLDQVTLFMEELVAQNGIMEGEYNVFIIMDGGRGGEALRVEYFTNHKFFEDIILLDEKLVVANIPGIPDQPFPPDGSVEIDSATSFNWADSEFASLYDFFIEEGQFVSTTFVERNIVNSATDVRGLIATDLTGDEQPEIISSYLSGNGNIDLYVNGAEFMPSFQVLTINQDLNTPVQLAASDLDRDGDTDFIAVSLDQSETAWFENENDSNPPTFIKRIVTMQSIGVQTVDVGDINGDGNMDVLTGSVVSGGVRISMSNGAQPPEFSDYVIDEDRGQVLAVKAVDIEPDGDTDFLASYLNTGEIVFYENLASPGSPFSVITTNTLNGYVVTDSANGARSLDCGDIDNDGDIDIVSGNFNDNQVVIYHNNGGAQPDFTPEILSGSAPGVNSVAMGNLDADPEMEVVAAFTSSNEVRYFDHHVQDPGDPQSPPTGYISNLLTNTHMEPRAIFVADINDDQLRDIVVASADDGRVSWFENTPTFSFSGIDLKNPDKDGLTGSEYDRPEIMKFHTQYNWQVVALNQLRQAQGDVWEFTTGRPDLVIDKIEFPFLTVGSGDNIDVKVTVRNRGSAQSNPVRVRVFASLRFDLEMSSEDIIIGDAPVLASLGPMGTTPISVPVDLSFLTQGADLGELKIYFLGAEVDYLDQQPSEFSEENIFKTTRQRLVVTRNSARQWLIYE